ncbi:unnamed protein product [Tetraodon nigroviridis]|uniref:Chromosome 10 SCAF14728, whole genome shotgun sequence n=1 Tax=Tetraodon nigroviridis TaxID=99883 RepID=Q4S6G1_TETNG|nr:unnamed protein product [Tetraodon nigroviridis]
MKRASSLGVLNVVDKAAADRYQVSRTRDVPAPRIHQLMLELGSKVTSGPSCQMNPAVSVRLFRIFVVFFRSVNNQSIIFSAANSPSPLVSPGAKSSSEEESRPEHQPHRPGALKVLGGPSCPTPASADPGHMLVPTVQFS